MPNGRAKARTSLWAELLSVQLYKRNHGRLTRQLTAISIAAIIVLGAVALAQGPLSNVESSVRLGIPLAISLIGGWISFRIVHIPAVADFLIAVQAEMDKVTWPSWQYLTRATAVVLATMFLLAVCLFLFDLFWQFVFSLPFIRFLQV